MDSKVEENYKIMRSELNELLNSDKRLTAIMDKISKGTASFKDSAEYSQIVADHMGNVISKHIGNIKIPMGKEMVCKELLKENIERVDTVFGKVQVSVDEKMGIHLNPVTPPYPTERVNAIAHSLEDPNADDEKVARRGKSSGNVVAARHDENVKANAAWREKAGFDCYLVRDAGGGCCAWCAALEGRYEYASAPDDIFRRHDNCTCTVTYECGKMRQDVWSKRTWEASPEKLQARKDAAEAAKPTVKTPAEAQAINEQSKSNITVLSKEQAEALNEQHKPTVLTETEAKEREAKALGKDDNVNNITVDNRGESDIIEVRKNSIEDKLKEAKTTSDVSRITLEHFKEKGSKIQNIDFGSCDIDAAKAIAIKADDLDSRFESSCASIDVVHLSPDYAGMTTPDSVSFNNWISSKNLDRNELTSRIKLNQSYLSSKEVIINDFHDHHRSKYSNLARNTWADEKNAFVTTFVHEYGHSILPGKANEIALQRGVINRDFMPFKRMYNTYMKELRDIEREISDIRTTYAGQTDGLRKGIEATKHLQAKYDSLCISHYSKESVGEFIAEAFCDAELSENPRTISLKVHETIEKLFGKKG